jgi:methyl-accepting chemotaxis protein
MFFRKRVQYKNNGYICQRGLYCVTRQSTKVSKAFVLSPALVLPGKIFALCYANGRFRVRKSMMNDDNLEINVDTQPESTVANTAKTPEPAPVPRRRGCFLLILGAVLGAMLGTALTLALLFSLNGTLEFSRSNALLRQAVIDNDARQNDLEAEMATRSAHLDEMATRVGEMVLQQQAMGETLDTAVENTQTLETGLTAVATDVAALDGRVEAAESDIENVAGAAESINAFLDGMRELLQEVKPATPTATTPLVTPSATAAPAETITRTVRPTRTPRPTSTPLPIPTGTPVEAP